MSNVVKKVVRTLLITFALISLYLVAQGRFHGSSAYLRQKHGFLPHLSPHLSSQIPTLIIASKASDNISWLDTDELKFRKIRYVVDDQRTEALTVPKNKGRESMVYLTYIIENYDHLPEVNIFMHPERYQWHNDDPDYDALRLLKKLQIEHILNEGYANLRCVWILGCPVELQPHIEELAGKTREDEGSTKQRTGDVYKKSFEELLPGVPVPEVVGVSCCAQFAVTADTIRMRPKSDYQAYRTWLLSTKEPDEISGRVFEYLWHIIFGKDAVHCPNVQDCYCKMYGLCDLECEEGHCGDYYTLARYSNLPPGWPFVGWEGEPRQIHVE